MAVEKALSALTPQQRIAVALRYWDDMTVPEVAQAMHLNPGTVKRYLECVKTVSLAEQAMDAVGMRYAISSQDWRA